MTHKTKGIVLKTIKYGETSVVVTILTELFGIQTYMVNGVRTSKKSGSKAALYQPATMLDLEVYHNELKAMNRIREAERSIMYRNLFADVVRHSIGLFMIELIHKTLKQPENNPDLFYFCEDAFKQLDEATDVVAANMPLYFILHLSYFHGFRIEVPAQINENLFIDLIEGSFTDEQPPHPHYITGEDVVITADLLRVMQPSELTELKLNSLKRRQLIFRYLEYYNFHIADFGMMKTLPILQEILS